MTAVPGDDVIARFYDEHPYPPPIDDLAAVRRSWSDGTRRRIEHFRRWPDRPVRDDHAILVAGCGTSQAAKYAARFPDAQVVGIDVSASSLRSTRDLATRHGLKNLQVERLPIEEVAALGASFEHVVCTGVLHHLEDPSVGLAALAAVLTPTGVIDLMVYARYGRTGVAMMQEYGRLLGIRPEPPAIDDLVSTLRELPVGHPIGHLLRNTPDFADDDALADALLNPRERSYSVPALFDLLAGADLRFDRWLRQAPYRPDCGVMRELPHGRRIAALPVVEQYAALELFRGTMVRHTALASRRDAPSVGPTFEGDAWQDFVPHRVTTSAVVTQKLPDGAAAVLLNRAHTSPDIVLFVDAEERAAFESIDGASTMGQIGGSAACFESFWRHDLIVVDTSAAG